MFRVKAREAYDPNSKQWFFSLVLKTDRQTVTGMMVENGKTWIYAQMDTIFKQDVQINQILERPA